MLNVNIQSLINDNIPASIATKQLTPELLELVYSQNWFNLWVPKEYGGLAADLRGGCDLLETLAYADGGFGWTVTLCAGANMFAGFIDPKLASVLFQERTVCWGGSGAVSGTAERQGDTFVLHGEWKYATGAPHLTHFTLNAWVYEQGNPVLDQAGNPVYHSFFVDRDQVLVHYDWDTFGLECTASHSFSIDKLIVPKDRAFDLLPDRRTHESALFHYPFMTFAECTLAVNYIGMFRRFLDLVERYFFVRSTDKNWTSEKGKASFRRVDEIRIAFEDKRERLYTLMTETWDKSHPTQELLNEIASLSRAIVRDVRTGTLALFPFTGIAGAQRDNEINIVFRHIFTASQHGVLRGDI